MGPTSPQVTNLTPAVIENDFESACTRINNAFAHSHHEGLSALHEFGRPFCQTVCNEAARQGLDVRDAFNDALATLQDLLRRHANGEEVDLPGDWLPYTIRIVANKAADYLRYRIRSEKHAAGMAAKQVRVLFSSTSFVERKELSELVSWVGRQYQGEERYVVESYYFSFLYARKKPTKRALARRYGMSRHRVRKVLAHAARLLQEFV